MTTLTIIPNEIRVPLSHFEHPENIEFVVEGDHVVLRSTDELPEADRIQQMMQEKATFEAQRQTLYVQYADQYVAMYEGKVVDSDADHVALSKRVHRAYGNQVILIEKVTETPPPPLRMGNMRLVRSTK